MALLVSGQAVPLYFCLCFSERFILTTDDLIATIRTVRDTITDQTVVNTVQTATLKLAILAFH